MNALKEIEIDEEVNKYKQKLDKDNQAMHEEIEDMKAEYEQKIKMLKDKQHDKKDLEEIEEEAEEIKHEIEFMMDEQFEKDKERKVIPQKKKEMEKKLAQYYKQVQEMNLIAKTFKKNVEMSSKIAYEFDEEEENETSNY